jgi:hypothetical protein
LSALIESNHFQKPQEVETQTISYVIKQEIFSPLIYDPKTNSKCPKRCQFRNKFGDGIIPHSPLKKGLA